MTEEEYIYEEMCAKLQYFAGMSKEAAEKKAKEVLGYAVSVV